MAIVHQSKKSIQSHKQIAEWNELRIREAFSEVLSQTTDLSKLKHHFKQYPKIEAMCYIPLNKAIIVFLCLLQHLPTTATEMYGSFILHMICRHLSREDVNQVEQGIKKLEFYLNQFSSSYWN